MGKEDLVKEFRLKVDDIFAVLNSINICADQDKFKNWLESEHEINHFEDIFDGYKFFLESAIRTFMEVIIFDSSLDIEEDFIFSRARFVGVQLNKIPNTCEKTILIKNINEKLKLVKKAKNWKEIKGAVSQFREDILDIFINIFENNVIVSPKLGITKEEALKYVSMYYIYIYLNDTSRFVPHGYWVSVLDNSLSTDQLEKNFKGYKYSLQYVWYILLENRYYSYSIKNMHNSKNWYVQEPSIFISESKINNPDINYDDVLDSYFGKIQNEIIKPLENEIKVKISFEKVLYLEKKISKSILKRLLAPIKEPTLNEKERLDYELLWYQIEFLDSSKSHIFNGVPAFTSMLAGTAELKRIFGDGEKAYICKFIHPDESVKGNDFSYGVLIQAFGSTGISDYSGWVIFYDCCGDYSGFSGSQHATAEMLIDDYKKRNLIDLREIIIDKNTFKNYIADKIISEKREEIFDELDKESKQREKNDIVSEARGLILELVTYYFLSKNNFKHVDWNIKVNKGQMDVIFESDNDYTLVECKNNSDNGDLYSEIKKLKNKLTKINTEKRRNCEFWFWDRPSQKTIDKLSR